MSYWKATEAKIEEGGTAITLGFKDEHSCSCQRMTLPVDIWKDILTYKNAYDEPERRMYEAQKRLVDYWRNSIQLEVEKKD